MGDLVGDILENLLERFLRVQVLLLVLVGLDPVHDVRIRLRTRDDLVRPVQNFERLLQVGELVNENYPSERTNRHKNTIFQVFAAIIKSLNET